MEPRSIAGYTVDYYPKHDGMETFAGQREASLWARNNDGSRSSLRVGEGPTDVAALGNLAVRLLKHGDPVDAFKTVFDLYPGQYRSEHGTDLPGLSPETLDAPRTSALEKLAQPIAEFVWAGAPAPPGLSDRVREYLEAFKEERGDYPPGMAPEE